MTKLKQAVFFSDEELILKTQDRGNQEKGLYKIIVFSHIVLMFLCGERVYTLVDKIKKNALL